MKHVNFGSTKIPYPRSGPGGEAYATANRAPERIVQSTTPEDSSKPGGTREWPNQYRLTGRNKVPGPEPMEIGGSYSMFDMLG